MPERSRVVMVAGASSGIGRATAAAAVRRGHVVFGTSRDPRRVDAPGVRPVQLETTDEGSVGRCVAEVLDAAGRIDAVVYSAGSYLAGAVEETSSELALAQFEAYLFGAHRLVRAVLPAMRERRTGRLVLISSSAAVAAIPFHAFYSASKAALERYADGLRYEIAPFGIDVACIQGTGVRTGAAASARFPGQRIEAYRSAGTSVIERFRRTQLTGPEPDRFGAAVVRAIEARSLRGTYRVGRLAASLPVLRTLLPDPVFRAVFARFFGLSGRP
jgi:NAD(P)-dependent dehydrogenase (short-subunit alcohol dehydrogenase family)